MANLLLTFRSEDNYRKAIKYFSTESSMFSNDNNDFTRTLCFEIDEDADSTEYYIDQELQDTDIRDYYFEIEESEVWY